jgi:SAM-dependent methyltransferase
MLAAVAARVLATDIHGPSIDAAARKYRQPNLTYQVADAAALSALSPASFDLITCFEVIEHVNEAEQRRLIATLARLLRPRGIAIVSTPDADVKSRVYERVPAWRNPFHVRELSASEFALLLAGHFSQVRLVPQTVELASVMRVPAPEQPAVRDSESWVNVAFASHSPVDLSIALPAVVIPGRAHLLPDKLSDVERLNGELAHARTQERALTASRAHVARLPAEWSSSAQLVLSDGPSMDVRMGRMSDNDSSNSES